MPNIFFMEAFTPSSHVSRADDDDAELIALRAEMEAADRLCEVADLILRKAESDFQNARLVSVLDVNGLEQCLEKTGVDNSNCEHILYFDPRVGWVKEVERLIEEAGVNAAEDQRDAVYEKMEHIQDKIVDLSANTLKRLIFKAKYAATHHPGGFDIRVALSIVEDLLAIDEDGRGL